MIKKMMHVTYLILGEKKNFLSKIENVMFTIFLIFNIEHIKYFLLSKYVNFPKLNNFGEI